MLHEDSSAKLKGLALVRPTSYRKGLALVRPTSYRKGLALVRPMRATGRSGLGKAHESYRRVWPW